ncbi:hypothetical protein ILYODFUR_035505 [Ilyodon furcidens]|uniref:Uncharacterized protein n=1 Tax=Ilyodon furcidens TaxID=33524 RepID=A0ABV0T2W2_9TELE
MNTLKLEHGVNCGQSVTSTEVQYRNTTRIQIGEAIPRSVGRNNSQRPIASLKVQGCNPHIHWGKPRHETAGLRGNKQTHPSPLPLPMGHFRVEESPGPLEEMGSRAHAVRGDEPCTSSGSFPPNEVTFHIPRASLSIRRLGRRGLHLRLPPNPLCTGPSWFPLQVVGPLGDGLA